MAIDDETGRKPVTLKHVYDIALAIADSGLEAEFLKLCKDKDLHVLADAQTRTIVGDFIDRKIKANEGGGFATRNIQDGDCKE